MQFLFDPQTSSQSMFSLGLIPGYAFNSGVLLMIILAVMIIGSMPFVRRGGCFEVLSIHFKNLISIYIIRILLFLAVFYIFKKVFYWTHLLYYAFWVLLIVHAPNFWKWFLIPGFIFLIEQVMMK